MTRIYVFPGLNAIDIARLKSRSETVVSGPEKDLETSQMVLEQAGAQVFERLPVRIAFHSRYMSEAKHDFGVFLASFLFAEPRIPVISNVTAQLYDSSQMKQMLARQIAQPVRWAESIEWLLQQPEVEFIEMGPGSVLTELIRRSLFLSAQSLMVLLRRGLRPDYLLGYSLGAPLSIFLQEILSLSY